MTQDIAELPPATFAVLSQHPSALRQRLIWCLLQRLPSQRFPETLVCQCFLQLYSPQLSYRANLGVQRRRGYRRETRCIYNRPQQVSCKPWQEAFGPPSTVRGRTYPTVKTVKNKMMGEARAMRLVSVPEGSIQEIHSCPHTAYSAQHASAGWGHFPAL